MNYREANPTEIEIAEHMWLSRRIPKGRPPVVNIGSWVPGQHLQTLFSGKEAEIASASIRRQGLQLGWRLVELTPQNWVRLPDAEPSA